MDHPWTQMWKWTLCVLLCGTSVGRGSATPHYMVAIPAVLESGAETKFCASLLQPNESLLMTVTLGSQHSNITLLEKTSSTEFNECFQFQVPLVQNEDVQMFEVQVRGDTFSSEQARKVMIKAYKPRIFIQTDKPIYLPGQTVHFRVVSLDSKLRSASMLYNIIQLEDSRRNRIGQWLNETSNSRILQLSYSLNSEAHEGLYKITVQTGEDKKFLRFEVEKYVLPKFDVTMHMNVWKGKLDARVCAQYTYRQPVPASITLKVCRPPDEHFYRRSLSPLCETKTKQTDMKGCGTFHFNISVFHLNQHLLNNVLYLIAAVEEDGTGISHTLEKMINLATFYGKLSFLDAPKLYEKGSNVEGKVKAVDYDDRPFPDLKLLLFKEDRNRQLLQNLTTDSNGVAAFSISTDKFKGQIKLSLRHGVESFDDGIPSFLEEELTLSEFLPPSPDTKTSSSLELKKNLCLPCDQESEVTVKYTIVGEAQGTVDVFYLVLSRGAIVMQGKKQIVLQDKSVNDGEVSFSLTVSADMAPEVQVVAYAALPSEAVIAHSSVFTTEKCFSNKVSLEFSPSPAVPAKEIKLQLTAQPNSVCGVSAIDQSVLIKKPGHTLDADKIFNLLPVQNVLTVPSSVEDPTVCSFGLPGQGREEANRVFLNMGLKMATNLVIQNPSCLFGPNGALRNVPYDWNPLDSSKRGRLRFNPSDGSPIPPPVQTVRTFFPETWIWDLVEVGPSGTKDVSLSVPDTITTWETETFCLSPQGFGLAPRQKLTVFQPFFLELTLPYSIIRGENFELKATVFNYLTKCIMMKVTAAPSSDYTLTPLSGDQYTSCLCANERKTLSWTMNPTALGVVNVTVTAEAIPSHASCDNEIVSIPDRGRIDTVTRPLIVKAEGVEVVKTHNWLLCPKGEALTEETEIQLPQNVIDGSGRAAVSVLGDILGRALQNLDGLLQMPYGCGEQNMALLAPNIYILEYLEKSNQLTPAIKEKASNFLSSGYQRQLNYKDVYGAYSTFGTGPGNTWLTAFVLRSFSKAKSFVYIDPEKLIQSKVWLEQKQNDSGCFLQSGSLFNNRMKGGVSDEVTLSAYITAAFLETKTSSDDLVVGKSLLCLKGSINDFSNTYTTALLAYVFTLAGDMETRAHLLQHLDSVAIKDGGFIHWSQTAAETSASLSVEISSYVLLARLSVSTTAEDLGYASGIVRWLTTQQNYYGGFSSTQDTVVALQALSLYSSLVFSPEGSSTVTVQSPSGPLTFDVTPDNKLLYQEKMLQGEAGKYSLEVKGTGCASVQISQHYNIPPPPDATTMSVEVSLEYDSSHRPPKASLKLISQYNGKEESTNMVILDITLLSGFIPDQQSLKNLERALLVDRVEHKNDHVVVYLQGLVKGTPINHSLELLQKIPVQNLKPAVIALYDYYQPTDRTEKEYNVANQA